MIIGAKLALILSFSHSAAKYIFSKLRDYLNIDITRDVRIDFEIQNGRLEIMDPNGELDAVIRKAATTAAIPVTYAFGTNMLHQGAIIRSGNEFLIYEPYGIYKKKLNGIEYDYFQSIKNHLESFGDVRKFHVTPGIQTKVLKINEEKYSQFLADFDKCVTNLKDRGDPRVSELRDHLKSIDIASESSKLVYVVEAVDFLRDECDIIAPFLKLYEKYSPYSCVSFTIIEIFEYFQQAAIIQNLDVWSAIHEVCRIVAPKFVNFIEEVDDCQMLKIRSWEI